MQVRKSHRSHQKWLYFFQAKFYKPHGDVAECILRFYKLHFWKFSTAHKYV
uniref:Uncharacterized protein n=1 Tax=Anguilla anguilla TaxID=7936 RepID=A0A0E9QMP0_ANGAN